MKTAKAMLRPLAFLGVVLFASVALNRYVYPRLGLTDAFWGSDLIHDKARFLRMHADEFNALAIGSSMVYRQVDPAVVDSAVAALTGDTLHTFNFGVNWLGSSELFYILEALDRDLHFDVIFMELQKIKLVDEANYFTTRVMYWYSWDRYRFTVRAVMGSTLPGYWRAAAVAAHTVNYLGYLLNLGYLTEAFHYRDVLDRDRPAPRAVGAHGNGFVSLEDQQRLTAGDDTVTEPERHRRFLRDTTVVTARARAARKAGAAKASVAGRYNAAYAAKLNALIDAYARRGTRLVCFIPPRLDRNHYAELYALFGRLPERNRIDLSDPRRYPAFYLAGYSYDATHMNAAGATLYSLALARAFAVPSSAD